MSNHGAVAQLGERLNGIQEVVGSIPISSTRRKPLLDNTSKGFLLESARCRRGCLWDNRGTTGRRGVPQDGVELGGSPLLHPRQGVAVGVQGDPDGGMPKPLADDLGVDPLLKKLPQVPIPTGVPTGLPTGLPQLPL